MLQYIQEDYKSNGSASKLPSLKNKIDEIVQQYNAAVKEKEIQPPKFERPDLSYEEKYKSYDAPKDDELSALAKASTEEYRTAEQSKIEKNASSKQSDLEQAKTRAQAAYDESVKESADYFEDARKNSSDSALKRGLARSSMAQLSQDAINASEASARTQMLSDLNRALSEMDASIRSAMTEREQALSDLDIKTAAQITQKLDALQQARDKKAAEVTEYNNSLKERLTKLAMEQEKWRQDYEKNEIDLEKKKKEYTAQVTQEAAAVRDKAVFQEISAYMSELSKKEALQQLESNPYFKETLSAYHYGLLRNSLNAS